MSLSASASSVPDRVSISVSRETMITGLGIAGLLVLWEAIAVGLLAGRFIIAPPSAIVARIAEDLPLFGRALGTTLAEAALGFAFGNLAALLLAILAVAVPRSERFIQALALVVFCLPLVATGPILRVLFGPGWGPQVTLAALAVYYTTFVPLVVGLRAVPGNWIDLVHSYGRGSLTVLFTVRIRAAVPYLVAGLQIAAPAAFLGAMVGEFTGADRGMGVLSIQTMRSLDVEGTWALATIATLVTVSAYAGVGWIGRLLSAGKPPVLLGMAATDRPSSRLAAMRSLLVVLAITAALLVIWQLAMDAFGLSRFFAKRPGDVLAYLVTGPSAAENRATLWAALATTLAVTIPGYLAGLAMGAILAAVFCLFSTVERVVTPIALALRSIPIVTTAPLIVLAMGRGPAGMVTIVAVMIFFPTLVACLQGLRQTPGQVHDVFDSYATNSLTKLWKAQVPAMLPAFFAAARMAVPAAVLSATVAEWLATGTGIGNLMALTNSTSNYNMLWSCVTVLTLLSVTGYWLVSLLERRILFRFAPEQVSA